MTSGKKLPRDTAYIVDWIRRETEIDGRTPADVARQFGVQRQTIYQLMNLKNGVGPDIIEPFIALVHGNDNNAYRDAKNAYWVTHPEVYADFEQNDPEPELTIALNYNANRTTDAIIREYEELAMKVKPGESREFYRQDFEDWHEKKYGPLPPRGKPPAEMTPQKRGAADMSRKPPKPKKRSSSRKKTA